MQPPSPRRRFLSVLLSATVIGTVLALVLDPAGGDEPRRSPKKGEAKPPKKPAKKGPKKEEVEESDLRPDESRPIYLAAEAKQAKGDVLELFNALKTPYDEVLIRNGTKPIPVQPLRRYIGPKTQFSDPLKMFRIDKNGKLRPLIPVRRKEIDRVSYYEEMALKKIGKFLDTQDLAHLQAAEKALIFVLRFHNTKRHKREADVKVWAAVEGRLRAKLLEVRREQVFALGQKGKWTEAFDLARLLAREHPREEDIQLVIPELALAKAKDTKRVADYVWARKRYDAFEGRFNSTDKRAMGIRDALKAKAKELAAEANDLIAKKDLPAAVDRLRKAQQIWPALKVLQVKLVQLNTEYLRVGVRNLPEYLSPALAATEAERQAVELLFEGLVKPTLVPGVGWQYPPGLAEGRPRVIPLGREFRLAEDAFWSDGKRLTATDIRHTVELLKRTDLPGRIPAWAKLVKNPQVKGSPYRVRITLSNGFLDPLSLMTFKVLPQQFHGKPLKKADDEEFGRQPVGSGPFQLAAAAEEGKAKDVTFTANPYYQRASKPNRPRIREIRFSVSADPLDDFRKGTLHLLLNLPTARVKELEKARRADDKLKDVTVKTHLVPRVYFLAINHGDQGKEALKNVALRLALAHGLDREAILDKCFRAGYAAVGPDGELQKQLGKGSQQLHPALNSPYPVGTWAAGSNEPLYDLGLARTKFKKALAELEGVKLTLKYPIDDPRVAKACEEMCAQWTKKLGPKIKVTAQGLSPRKFREAVNDRDYDLAYCQYDYTGGAYWLWPLFDPDKNALAFGGSNILCYEDDDILQSHFVKAMNRRDFRKVKTDTRDIRARLNRTMPLIPLWQLHQHLAVHARLNTGGRLDPLRVFANVEDWKWEKK
jgi:ABC-type oligopeptide transport system substrate-binding subunit